MSPADLTTQDRQHIVRERAFDVKRSDVNALINMLHLSHSTGQLIIHLSQGGIQAAVFIEKHVVFGEESQETSRAQ